MSRLVIASSTVVVALGCGDGSSATGAASTGSGADGGGGGASCHACDEPEARGAVANAGITEASGIVASKLHPGAYYVHNDSGDGARFFAVDERGQDLGTFRLSGVTAIDWEDVARGPCPDPAKSCLFFADFGDNDRVRSDYVIYRVEEPEVLGVGVVDVAFDALRFRYADGARDAEALLAHPETGQLVIVTKDASGSQAYALDPPPSPTATITLRAPTPVAVAGLIPLVTGGDVRPDGGAIALRTYVGVWLYTVAPGESLQSALGRQPCPLPTPSEKQGESVSFLATGAGYVTLSEGASAQLMRVACAPR